MFVFFREISPVSGAFLVKKGEMFEFSKPWVIWVFPKIVVHQNGWFIMENPIKMDDLGVSLFLETPI